MPVPVPSVEEFEALAARVTALETPPARPYGSGIYGTGNYGG